MRDLHHNFFLKAVYINPNHVISIEEDTTLTELFRSNPKKFPEDLDERQVFSSISFTGGTATNSITIVGDSLTILAKEEASGWAGGLAVRLA